MEMEIFHCTDRADEFLADSLRLRRQNSAPLWTATWAWRTSPAPGGKATKSVWRSSKETLRGQGGRG